MIPDDMWADTLDMNVTANYLLADEAAKLFEEQGLHGNIVFTSSANAVVAKRGSEAYDVSKAALSHLIRELAVSMAPNVRVNGISPATVVKGSTMFPRDRVRASLKKYNIPFQESFSDEELRSRLAAFYAERTLTQQGDRSGRLRGGDPLPGQPSGALHHGTRDSRGRRTDRGVSTLRALRNGADGNGELLRSCKNLHALPLI